MALDGNWVSTKKEYVYTLNKEFGAQTTTNSTKLKLSDEIMFSCNRGKILLKVSKSIRMAFSIL